MAESKDMSEWIKFFTGAGIPPGPASTYAVTFIDNRIKRGMLIDLTKEYLRDMGISVMGDIISILKHSKSVHAREEREKPALSALPVASDGKVEIKRQTTPGSRMLEHFLRKEGINVDPEPKVKVSTEMATRLGAVPKTGSKAVLDVSQIKQVEVKPVKKPRKLAPEPDPEQPGVTEGDSKKSVFDRLGGAAGNNGKKGLKRVKSDSQIGTGDVSKNEDSSSVFRRLGGMKRQKTISLSSDDGSVLEYAGVLKAGAEPKRPKQQKVTITLGSEKLVNVQDRLGIKAGETKSSAKLERAVSKKSVLDRLGPQKTVVPLTSRVSPGKSEVSSSSPTTVKIVRTIENTAAKTSVQERLGPQKAEASSTSEITAAKPVHKSISVQITNIRERLGTSKAVATSTSGQKITLKKGSGVVKRLGTQTKTAAVPLKRTAAATHLGAAKQATRKGKATGAVLGRLGLPIYQTETQTVTTTPVVTKTKPAGVRARLGTQKAEATSTTSSTTVRLVGKKTATKKIVRASGTAVPKKSASQTVIVRKTANVKKSGASGVFSRLGAKST